MNEHRQNAINHLKTHLGCVGYRDYLITELEKLEQIEQIINGSDNFIKRDSDYRIAEIKEVLENE